MVIKTVIGSINPDHKLSLVRGSGRALLIVALSGVIAAGCGGSGGGGGSSGPGLGGVEGRVFLPGRLVLDTDTPDPLNPQSSNDAEGLAQQVTNLSFVAGHADAASDPDDYFSVELAAGEKLYLKIADQTPDLDLYLYQGGTVIESTLGLNERVENVTAPVAGSFIVRVSAVAGGSIYNLALGLSPAGAGLGARSWTEADDFAIGEAVVKFKSGGPKSVLEAGSSRVRRGMAKAEYAAARDRASRFAAERDASLHRLDPRGLALLKFQLDGASPAGGTGAKEGDPPGERAMKRATLEKVREFNNDPAVAYAEPNFIAQPTIEPGDTHFGLMWNLRNINAPAAWDVTTGDTQTIIAIVDTGILYDHPDLEEKILKDGGTIVGYDMIHDPDVSKDGDGLDPDPYDVGDKDTDEIQSSFHGTHVAGIAAAASDNGIGIAGVSWQAKIMPVRVLGRGGGYFYDIAQGIYYAAGLPNDSGTLPMIGDTVRPAHIINLSLGDASPSQFVQDAVLAARNQGLIVIAAAGNESTSAPFYPAASFGVVAVSATDLNGDLSYYSNYGSYVDLAAPGGDTHVDLDGDGNDDGVLSTRADDSSGNIEMGYSFEQGTSMASPHVAGVAALIKSVFESGAPGLTFSPQIFDLLIEGALESDTIGSITNYDKGFREPELGYGQIDALNAVSVSRDLSQSTELQAPRLALEPDELNFGFDSTQLTCMVANFGLTPLAGVTVDPSYQAAAPWLGHDLQDPFITFTADRSLVPDGPYSASVTVNSDNGGSEAVNIILYKSPPFQSDAGTIYVILTDPAAGETPVALYIATADAANGYFFSIKGVLPGTYLLSAGTDIDSDDFLGDNGELLGRYPSLGRSTSIVVSPGVIMKNRDFSLSFIGLPSPAGGVLARNHLYYIR